MSDNPALMGAREARNYRSAILGLCILSLICVFQPFSLTLFSVGCLGVICGGLIFNIMPFCAEGTPRRKLLVGLGWVFGVLLVMALLASAAAYGYIAYLTASR